MNCIQQVVSSEYLVKKSRFIGYAAPCESELEVKQILRAIYQQHQDANHLAFAYRLCSVQSNITRFNDAGEPKGTAGKPILAHLEGKALINLVVGVVRYFGGVKLGAGGLVRAYGTTAKNTLDACAIIEYQPKTTLKLVLDYKQMDTFKYQLAQCNGQIISQDFAAQISLLIEIPEQHRQLMLEKFPNYS
jgi:uncharacterized YigZ family protein